MTDKHAVRLTLEIDEDNDEPLEVVRGIVQGTRTIEERLREWVGRARRGGNTWQEIADALEVTRQSAWERFKVVDEERGDAVDRAMGAFADRPGPTSDEMRKQSRSEEEEIELRKWGSLPAGTKWRSSTRKR